MTDRKAGGLARAMEGPQSGAGVWGPRFGAEVLGSRFQDQGWSQVWGLGTLDKDEDWGSGSWARVRFSLRSLQAGSGGLGCRGWQQSSGHRGLSPRGPGSGPGCRV